MPNTHPETLSAHVREWTPRIHAQAVKSGWWDGGIAARSPLSQTLNFRAELAEAWEEYRHRRMYLWWSHDGLPVPPEHLCEIDGVMHTTLWKDRITGTTGLPVPAKPEGFWIEIADFCIRLFDTTGAYHWPILDGVLDGPVNGNSFSLESSLDFLYGLCNAMTTPAMGADGNEITATWDESAGGYAMAALALSHAFASWNDQDLRALIRLKHFYNRHRSRRHGNLKA